jgi:hypothetical protein
MSFRVRVSPLRLVCIAPVALLLGGLACSSEASQKADAGPEMLLSDAGACGVTTAVVPSASANHVAETTELKFASNPPCGGDHFGAWALWGVHETPLPRGNWIHNLEHGGVALLYRCASRAACPELAAKVEAFARSLPADPSCVSPVRNRVIVTPDPLLPEGVQVAAASWGYTWVARCLDETLLRDFYAKRYARAPENTCAQGFPAGTPGGMDGGGDGASGDAAVVGSSDASTDG